ncbi:MAG: nucleotidyltransferase domain-containing protein [Oscillospiraceae bacterium]|jgi:predicted nucleotidyltransferase|nr:nucleotidyltransferase domain-containing protein [Oscillospiraceae bacterium]
MMMLHTDVIREKAIPIARKYHVKRLELFGSYANGNATEASDADFPVEFLSPTPSIFAVMGLREELSRSLGKDVDVVTLPLPRPEKLRVERTERIL